MTVEEWRPAPGHPDYAVSSLGRLISHKRPTPYEMRGGLNEYGYRIVSLSEHGRGRMYALHRLVSRAFLGETPPGLEVRHLDGDKSNNAVSNLAFGTASENMLDQVRHGVHNMARKTHCPQGHPYDDLNTYIVPSTGGRMCRICIRARKAARAAA